MIEFDVFFGEVHDGIPPYPWQCAFAEAAAAGRPPSLVRAPTGSGKTGVLDALVWALAAQADRAAHERTVGLRIIWAIDRRILVDEVHEHANWLAGRLRSALTDSGDPLRGCAEALAGISGGSPLVATRWRGGIERDRAMVPPNQPQVVTSTVGQIGSRMLFRGYGVADRSLALAAGLSTCDSTICLDEAHLAEPFAQTARWIRDNRAGTDPGFIPPPLDIVTLTATPTARADDQITIGAEDVHALGKRLTAPKVAILDDSPGTESERTKALVDHSIGHLAEGATRIACVVNSVRQARAVFDRLSVIGEREGFDTVLLIGPQRPVDRHEAIAKAAPILEGSSPDRPLVCVATQTFEVGLDADVEAMVTESASAAALIQRFGRLNRRGKGEGSATIVRNEAGWPYTDDELTAWEWLESRLREDGTVDVSVMKLDRDPALPAPANVALAPELDEDVVRLLAQTYPRPGPFQDPDIETFLRGPKSPIDADVAVCWRSDLHHDLAGETAFEYRRTLLTLVPPERHEQLSLSVNAARGLIRAQCMKEPKDVRAGGAQALADTDLEGEVKPASGELPVPPVEHAVPFSVIRGDSVLDGSLRSGTTPAGRELVRPQDLRPGDVVVLAAQLGGVDAFGLAPGGGGGVTLDTAFDRLDTPLEDDGARNVRAIRLSRAALGLPEASPDENDPWSTLAALLPPMASGAFLRTTEEETLAVSEHVSAELPHHSALLDLVRSASSGEVRLVLRAVGSPTKSAMEMEDLPDDGAAVLLGVTRPGDLVDRGPKAPPPTLEAHARSVRERVGEYTSALALTGNAAGSLHLAALAHDHGKADPRIQAFFHRGIAPLAAPPVAKSDFGLADPATAKASARLAGLPRKLNHEIASAAILAEAIETAAIPEGEFDTDLALHLVSTHHGRARPFPAVPSGGSPPRHFACAAGGVTGSATGDGTEGWLAGAQLRRFWDVLDRFGPWGAAYLEAVLMLADRTVSAEGR